MDTYLRDIKNELKSSLNSQTVVIILGNESCDLDSAVSSLVYGYYLHWLQKFDQVSKNEKQLLGSKIFIPVLNVRRIDLPIKTEVVYFLTKNTISLENIICKNELEIDDSLLSKNNSRIVLVDHHILGEADKHLFKYVSNIFDHRPKDVSSWKYEENINCTIVEVGSCTTLISAEIHNAEENYDFLNKNKDVAYLLYGTIVLDTVNFLPSADRAKPLDFEMATFLETFLNIEDTTIYRKKLFEELLAARTDYSQLSVDHLLKRDLKIINGIPIPGLPMLVQEYLGMPDSLKALESFSAENKFSVIVLMGLKVKNDTVNRDMAIFSTNNTGDDIVKVLCESTNPNIGLIEKESPHEKCRYFSQSNIKASRKQIIPILKTLNNHENKVN